MRPVASAYSVSAYLQPQFATLNTRCLIFYTYPLSVLQAKWFPLDPQPLPPKKTQTHTNPKLSLPTIRCQICLSCHRLLPASNSPHDSSQHHRSKNSHFGMGGGEKKKNPNRKWNTSFHKDIYISLSLSLSSENLFSQRRNSYATKTGSPKLKFVSDQLLQNCESIQRDYFFVNGVPAAQESSDSRSAMQKLFASNEIDRARRQLEYSRFPRERDRRRAATDVSGLRSP